MVLTIYISEGGTGAITFLRLAFLLVVSACTALRSRVLSSRSGCLVSVFPNRARQDCRGRHLLSVNQIIKQVIGMRQIWMLIVSERVTQGGWFSFERVGALSAVKAIKLEILFELVAHHRIVIFDCIFLVSIADKLLVFGEEEIVVLFEVFLILRHVYLFYN